jgi:ubiquinone/menaquinone biosynthesis C-methylase UbiE
MHKFKYNEQERRIRQNPEEILKSIGVVKEMVFMDIGCNDGFFTIPAARMVGKSGKVYGVDIDVEAIVKLLDKAKRENIQNIKTKVTEAENIVFCEECADIIFYGTVLHDFNNPGLVLQNAMKMLKVGGKIVNYDWKKKETQMGPPLAKRLSEIEASDLIQNAGFKDLSVQDISDNFYQITASKY